MKETFLSAKSSSDPQNILDNQQMDPKGEPTVKYQEGFGPGNNVYYQDTLSSCEDKVEVFFENNSDTPTLIDKAKVFFQPVLRLFGKNLVSKDKEEQKLDTNSMADVIGSLKEGALSEGEKPDSKVMVLTSKIEEALREEDPNWKELDMLIRQLSILLSQKMMNNDHKTIQEELKLLAKDIERVRGTYNTKWELTLGITIGVISISGGLVGMGGGIGGFTSAFSKGFLDSIGKVTQGAQLVSQGGQPFKQIISNNNEKNRALYNFEMERDRGHKSTVESAQQNARSQKGGQTSQLNSAIEAAYRAFQAMAS